MTKPKRADAWTFNMAQGLAKHLPTGLAFTLLPFGADLDNSKRLEELQAAGLASMGLCKLPDGASDRRQDPPCVGDANAPAAKRWHILVPREAHDAAFDALAARHGPVQAREMLQAICKDAGERWVFRARLERGWTNGQRAT
jgi:hypothetical protein